MQFVIFDLEYTTWQGAQDRHWMGDGEYKEIIEIGALKINFPDFTVVDKFNIYIRPVKNPILSAYCKELTGITQDQIDQGVPFAIGYEKFLKFCTDCLITSYGNDVCILAENLILTNTDPLILYGTNSPSFLNLNFWISQINKNIGKSNSGSLWKYVTTTNHFSHNKEHNAIDDCYSILEVLFYMYKQNIYLPFGDKI